MSTRRTRIQSRRHEQYDSDPRIRAGGIALLGMGPIEVGQVEGSHRREGPEGNNHLAMNQDQSQISLKLMIQNCMGPMFQLVKELTTEIKQNNERMDQRLQNLSGTINRGDQGV